MPAAKDHPTYLRTLGIEAAGKAANMLTRINPEGISRGETLTAEQYHILLNQVTSSLKESGKLPRKAIPEIRFQAFENPFYETLQSRGLI